MALRSHSQNVASRLVPARLVQGVLLASMALAVVLGGSVAVRTDEPAKPSREAIAAQQPLGKLIRIDASIADKKVRRRIEEAVNATIQEAKQAGRWPVLIFELQPGRIDFGQAYDLADYLSGPKLNGATTVAYLPEAIHGHAVLVALACDEILMAPKAEIGDAGKYDAIIDAPVRTGYSHIAARRKTVPPDVALAMLDKDLELLAVETEVSREFVLASNLEELRKQKSFQKSTVIKRAGDPGVFSAAQARELGFVGYLANDRDAVAKLWKLPREAVEDDPSLGDSWRPASIFIREPITPTVDSQVQQLIQNETLNEDTNLICIRIDSAGGSPPDSISLANYLAKRDPTKQRTVGYIQHQARGDAAWLALACDQIVMHPEAKLGGSGDAPVDPQQARLAAQSLIEIARAKRRPAALMAAFADSSLVVGRYLHKQDGRTEYFLEGTVPADFADLRVPEKEKDQWQREADVSRRDQPLLVDGKQALQLNIASYVVNDFHEFKALYGLENDPKLIEPTWAMTLVDALNSDGMKWLLLFVGAMALYIELHTPGVGIGGILGALCFLLYFWSSYLGGTAGWLEAILFGAGAICLLMEIFVLPGFGAFGVFGGLLVISSLVLASQTFVLPRTDYQVERLEHSLLVLVGAGVASVAAAVVLNRYLPSTPMFNRMLLAPPTGEELSEISRRESLGRFEHLVGREGVASTPLLPAGKARFGEELVDVIADGEFIERGQRVVVVEARSNRVLVRAVTG